MFGKEPLPCKIWDDSFFLEFVDKRLTKDYSIEYVKTLPLTGKHCLMNSRDERVSRVLEFPNDESVDQVKRGPFHIQGFHGDKIVLDCEDRVCCYDHEPLLLIVPRADSEHTKD